MYWWIEQGFSQNGHQLIMEEPNWGDAFLYEDNYTNVFGPFDASRLSIAFKKRKSTNDITFVSCFDFTCSETDFQSYAQLFSDQLRLFHIKISGENYVTFVAKNAFDILDVSNCDCHFTSDGTPYRFRAIAMNGTPPKGVEIFNFPNALYINVVTDNFKKIYEDAGHTGLRFKPVQIDMS